MLKELLYLELYPSVFDCQKKRKRKDQLRERIWIQDQFTLLISSLKLLYIQQNWEKHVHLAFMGLTSLIELA